MAKLVKRAETEPPPAPRIAAASLSASGSGVATTRRELARAIETAMSQAVLDALADGVSIDDSPEILRRKQIARGQVLEAHGQALPTEVVTARTSTDTSQP